MKSFRLLMIALWLIVPTWALAESTLVVELTNGRTQYFRLDDNPVLTMGATTMNVKTDVMTMTIERSSVRKAWFAADGTGIQAARDVAVTYEYTPDGDIAVSHLEPGTVVLVYDMSGRKLGQTVSRAGEVAVVRLAGSSDGLYIVKIGNQQTIKIAKK